MKTKMFRIIIVLYIFAATAHGQAIYSTANSARFADQFPGADCGAKIINADMELGAEAGEIWIVPACGSITTAPRISPSHVLRFFPGTYPISATITLPPNGVVFGDSHAIGAATTNAVVMLNWTGSTNGPIFWITGSGISSSDIVTRGAVFDGFSMENTGTASGLIGILQTNTIGANYNHLNAEWRGGTCVELLNTSSLWNERTTFGPAINFNCGSGGDIAFVVRGGTNSFGYTNILGSHLDNYALNVGNGAALYHSILMFHSNVGKGNIITLAGAGSAINDLWDVRAECSTPAGTAILNLSASAILEGQGMIEGSNCGTSTLTPGSQFRLTARTNTDGAVVQTGGQYPGVVNGPANVTVPLAADRTDKGLANEVSEVGMWSNFEKGSGGFYLNTNTTPGRGCISISNGPITTLSSNPVKVAICDNGTIGVGGNTPIPIAQPIMTNLVTSSATSDNVTVPGMTSTGHCVLTATNAAAATNIAATYVSAKTADQITVTHKPTASMNYDIACTPQ